MAVRPTPRLRLLSSSAAQQPAKKPSTPKVEPYWQSANAQQLLQAGKKLRYASSSQLLADADRATRRMAAAAGRLSEPHRELDSGSGANPTPSSITRSASSIRALLDLVPPGPQSDKILADYVDFVGNSSLYQQSPAEWFVEPHTLLERSSNNGAQHSKVLEAFQGSGNPVLALEVMLEKTFRSNLPTWAVSAK